MTIADIIKLETDRNNSFNVVHLIKDGNFYHANDWSAWLMTKFPIGEAINKPMNVTAKKLKDGYTHAFVGFPVTSLGKYVPNDGSVTFVPVSDEQIDVTLNVDFGDATIEDVRAQVDEWKESLPIIDKKQKRESRDVSEVAPRATRMSDIVNRILSFPLADKSPMEAWEFVRQLQQQAVSIF